MKLKFKQQGYQSNASQAVVDCFIGQTKGKRRDIVDRSSLSGQISFIEEIVFSNKSLDISDFDLLKNVQNVQKEQGLIPVKKLAGMDFTIEMETGTGKTYVYTKTMYELNRHYGWSKFIIMVPSIAIREGVNKSLQITAEHFQEIYGKKIRFSIYDAKKKNNITNIKTFASSSAIEVIIMNYQAFAARSEDAKRIYRELDEMQSRKPIDVLKSTRPILIIDEPQKFGKQANESIKNFNSLFNLRYSATHRDDFNKIYRLDAVDAFNQKLVKKINVKGIEIVGNTGTDSYLFLDRIEISDKSYPRARLEFELRQANNIKRVLRVISEGDDLYQLSGELNQYQGFVVNSIDALKNTISFTNGIVMEAGQASGGLDEKHLRRIQIRETIKSHLEKEKELFKKGIKVLSLFFIDEVAKYRQYDEANRKIKGEYAEIFEEEYKKAIIEFKGLFDQDYQKYLDSFSSSSIHNAYFSIDKKGNYINSKESKSEGASDDVDAYDLIMKDKERLLSLSEPTRFIFSHSALREGWDNPNIFQICTLKQAQAEISKRQEIGRGLRICVNNEGERMDFSVLESSFFEINNLTVIASESYDKFAKDLQKEILDSLSDRPVKLTVDVLKGRTLKNNKGDEFVIDDAEAMNLIFFFKENGYIDSDYKISEKMIEDAKKDSLSLPENVLAFKSEIIEIMNKIYLTSELKLANNERESNSISFKLNDNFYKKEFQNLWSKIKVKTVYELDFSSDELIQKSINSINSNLKVNRSRVFISSGTQGDSISEESLREGKMIDKKDYKVEQLDYFVDGSVKYDLVNEISKKTILTRKSVAEILRGIKAEVFLQFQLNPEDFIRQVSSLILNQKATTLINSISYSKLSDVYSDDVFTVNSLKGSLSKDILEVKKHIYNYLKVDSDIEKKFAQDLESGQVMIYAKLPRDFKIPTPLGNYNPDWAIVFDNKDFKYIYFITETKGSMDTLEFRETEKRKIEYAKKHFEALKDDNIKYDVVDSYDSLLNKVMK
jgi:type III restriction enzyme